MFHRHYFFGLLAALAASLSAPTRADTNEPLVRLLVPGFTVQELPVKLSNQNNLRFAPDGSLTALGYDGRVWRLRDTNGDSLEDTAEPFWDQSTLSVPVGMTWSTQGLYVSSHGKVSLLKDTDVDGRADVEEVVASGWPAGDVASGGVDATAVTLDKSGNVYFGLVGADYSNAYRLRKRKDLKPAEIAWLQQNDRWREPAGADSASDEFSLYDLHSQRGTIQRLNPRTKRLTTVATGIRVPYALAFNRAGDLFNTDQEGETWMPNGNPLDELNQIVIGRNYGFPPSDGKWLTGLESAAPIVSFGPQHQSTCGFVFNEPHAAFNSEAQPAATLPPPLPASPKPEAATTSKATPGKTGRPALPAPPVPAIDTAAMQKIPRPAAPAQGLFGPKGWDGDAFVAGESRGKIWRVRLVKTPSGYVGKEYLFARIGMLVTDVTISPRGDLYVCAHSGPPDWGTGPKGEGKIFKITYTDPKAPQPVIAWPANATEVRVAFDRPLDPVVTNAFNPLYRLPGNVLKPRDATPSGIDDTDFLSARPAIEFGEYVRAADRFEKLKPPYAVVAQQDATPRGHLTILGARLDNADHTLVLTTAPHPLPVTYALTIPAVKAVGKSGAGETVDLDYDLSGTEAALVSQGKMVQQLWQPHPDWDVSWAFVKESAVHQDFHERRKARGLALATKAYLPEGAFQFTWWTLFTAVPEVTDFEWKLTPPTTNTATKDSGLELKAFAREGANGAPNPQVALQRLPGTNLMTPPLAWFRVPWAPANHASSGTDSRAPAFVAGDWENGRGLFFGDKLGCAQCHRVRGEGATVGPDLSNLVHRDATSVLRDVRDPNATLHPDYVTYQAELKNGETITGFLRSGTGDEVRLVDAAGKDTVIPRADLKELHPTGQSLMPTGLLDSLKDGEVKDLLTFLLREPPVRTRAEVERVLERSTSNVGRSTLKIVLVASKQDHGPGQHDYPAWQTKWQRLFSTLTNVGVTTAWEWPSAEQFANADVLVLYFWNHDWSAARYAQLDAYQARGGGLVVLHSATIADKEPEQLAERIGLAAQPATVKYRHTPFDLRLVQNNPLTRGLTEWLPFLDEPYWPMIGDPTRVTVLATAEMDGAARPLMWTFEHGKGRVFASIPGHYFHTLDDPFWRALVLRGIAWAARHDMDELISLATTEAQIK